MAVMDASVFLARMLGPFLLVVGAGLAIGPANFRATAEEFLASRALVFVAGLFAFLPGLAIVLTHNLWTADWRVIITIVGWLGVVGGAFRLLFPAQVQAIGTAMLRGSGWLAGGGIAASALGLVLSYFGFVA
jgi:hypothetical protein